MEDLTRNQRNTSRAALYGISYSTFSLTPFRKKALSENEIGTYASTLRSHLGLVFQTPPGHENSGVSRGQEIQSIDWECLKEPDIHEITDRHCIRVSFRGGSVAVINLVKANSEEWPLLLIRSSSQFQRIFFCWFERFFDTNVRRLLIPVDLLERSLENYVAASVRIAGDLELTFGIIGCETLRKITITLQEDDVLTLAMGSSLLVQLTRLIHQKTGIELNKLKLSRTVCPAYALSSEGKLKTSQKMPGELFKELIGNLGNLAETSSTSKIRET
ncbi:uncharacterized protein V1510DRAFT_409333, partial [Dipodascopsis tothii]|uniref:uncharacterized protein n=1 Tax=Dipodascopsis tothii TaxID=44089 RepID=UPI0034CFF9FB